MTTPGSVHGGTGGADAEDAALIWAGQQVGAFSAEVVKARPWATVWRLRTASGVLYLKRPGSGGRHEGVVLSALGGRPDPVVPSVVAFSPGTGFLLLADAGPVLRERLGGSWDLASWERLLARFAAVQVDAVGLVPLLLAAGVPDERPEALPDVVASLGVDVPPRVAEVLRADALVLAELGVPSSLQHGDLHDGNVLVDGDRFRFIDLGDSSVAHPFTVLPVALERARAVHGIGAADEAALTDAYLGGFTSFAPLPALRRALSSVTRGAAVVAAAAWARALMDGTKADVEAWGDPVRSSLSPLLSGGEA